MRRQHHERGVRIAAWQSSIDIAADVTRHFGAERLESVGDVSQNRFFEADGGIETSQFGKAFAESVERHEKRCKSIDDGSSPAAGVERGWIFSTK
jgi:hypothetical protein